MLPQEIEDLIRERAADTTKEPALCIIMRGIPGCGKTTVSNGIARLCLNIGLSYRLCSADHWFMRGGSYERVVSELEEAHMVCRAVALEHMLVGTNVVVIDNTNLKTEHYMLYVNRAIRFFYEPVVVEFAVYSEMVALEVCRRSRHFKSVDAVLHYNPWRRVQELEWDDNAIQLSPLGLTPQERRQHMIEERGYRR